MIVILVVALVVVGPDKLPELARSLAKGVNELKGTLNQVKENLSEETKVISSVKEDLQKTAVQMKNHLLEDTRTSNGDGDSDSKSKIWRQEDVLVEDRESDKDDVIDMQSLEERPWEKDAAAEPQKKVAEVNQEKQPLSSEGSTNTDDTAQPAENRPEPNLTAVDEDNKENTPPTPAV